MLEWVAVPSSRGSSQRREDQTHVSYVSCIGRQVLYPWRHRESPLAATADGILWGAACNSGDKRAQPLLGVKRQPTRSPLLSPTSGGLLVQQMGMRGPQGEGTQCLETEVPGGIPWHLVPKHGGQSTL